MSNSWCKCRLSTATVEVAQPRRSSLKFGIAAGLLALCSSTLFAADGVAVDPEEERWQTLAKHYFGDREVQPGEGLLEIEAPKRAHDAAVVPISIRTTDSSRSVRKLHLIVDKNPLPLAGIVTFSDAAHDWETLETRIRINEYTHVRAIGELDDGSLHMVAAFVKAAGGCSAPAMGDLNASIARAGRMNVLFGDAPDAPLSSPVSEAVIKISHPNNSGMQFDQVSRHYIPAFYVDTIGAELDGEPLFTMKTNFSMSENPTVRLRYRAVGDSEGKLTATATDSKGNDYIETSGEGAGS